MQYTIEALEAQLENLLLQLSEAEHSVAVKTNQLAIEKMGLDAVKSELDVVRSAIRNHKYNEMKEGI